MLDADCSKNEEDDVEVGNIMMAKTNNDKKYLKLNQKRKKLHLDSGCSRPMTGTRSLFISLKAKDGGQITFADNSKARIIGADPIAGDVPVLQVRGDNSNRGGSPPRIGQQATITKYPRALGKRKHGSLRKRKITPNAREGKMNGKRKRMSLEEEPDEIEQIPENPMNETENVEGKDVGYDSDDLFMVLYNKATKPEKCTIDYRNSVRELGDILNHNLDDIASNHSIRKKLLEYLSFFEAAPKESMSLEMRKSLNFISSQCRSILVSYDTSKAILDRLNAFERKKDDMVQSIKEGDKKFKAIRKQQKELLKGREQLEALEDEITRLREELEKKEKEAKQMSEYFKTQDKKLKDLRETNEDLKEEASRLDEALDSLLNEYEGVREEGEEAQAEQDHLRSSWQALKVKFDADRPNYGGTSMI